MRKYLLLLLLTILFSNTYGQGPNLNGASAFCASGAGLTYNNSCNGSAAQPGINYGCVLTQPNAAWFFVQVDAPGTLAFQISQVSNGGAPIDVDFIAWGPFPITVPQTMPAPGQLTGGNTVGCSYSTAAVENLTINNNTGGVFYVIVITNFSGQCGQITLTQTNLGAPGAGTTNCDVVCPTTMSPDAVICQSTVQIVSITPQNPTTPSATYQWYFNGGIIPGATAQTYPATQPGQYCVHFTDTNCVAQDKCVTLSAPTPAPVTQPPVTLEKCGPAPVTFDLTQNSLAFMGLGSSYDISYYTSPTDAANAFNAIVTPSSFVGTDGQTIWINVTEFSDPCPTILSFTLDIKDCGTPVQPNNLAKCEAVINTGIANFDLTNQIAAALGTNNPADYTITLHTSLADANADANAISPVNSFNNTTPNLQTIYVRMESNSDPTMFDTIDFQLIIHPQPATPNPADVQVCDSYTLPALPAGQSYHSASGGAAATQIPAGTNITTTQTIYIFAQSGSTPNCTAEGDFIVTVYPTPTAPNPADVQACDGYVLPVLPAGQSYHSASGGVAATQIPAGTNITTTQTIYIFAQSGTVPNCSSEGDFIVSVYPAPVAPNPADVQVCDSYNLPALPAGQTYHSASGGVAATQIPGGTNITTTQTIYIFAQSGTVPNCTSEGDFIVTVYPTPVADAPADVVACNSYTLPALTVGGYFTGPNGSGTPVPVGTVILTSQTLYVYAQSGTVPNCSSQNSFDIAIYSSPVINNPATLNICDDNNDGFSCFVLSSMDNSITGGAPGLVVTYHETLANAQNGVIALNSANYCNIVQNQQTIHVRVVDAAAPLCYSLTTLVLKVNRVPVPKPIIGDYNLCDVNNPGDDVEGFDLPSMDAEILNGQTGINVTYYHSQPEAASETGAINTAVAYLNTANPEKIWVRLEDQASGCYAVSSFNLVVNDLPVVTALQPMNQCGTFSGIAVFDLTTNNLTVSGGVPGRSVAYYLDQAHLLANDPIATPGAFTNTTNPQDIVVQVTNDSTECTNTTILTLTVSQGPPAGIPTRLEVCDPNNDGFATFDLTQSYTDIIGSATIPAGIAITFHLTQTDAQNGVTLQPTTYNNINQTDQTLLVRVTYTATGCYTIVELPLHVNNTPVAVEIAAFEVCDDDTDGKAIFDLTSLTDDILGSLDAATHTVKYYVLQIDAQSGTGPIGNVLGFENSTPYAQTIWVRVEDNNTGCFDVVPLQLVVNKLPLMPPTPDGAVIPFTKCDENNPGDEREEFDLSLKIPEILNGQTGVSVSFYASLADAQGPSNPLANLYTNVPNAQTLYVRLQNDATGCFVLTTMDLRVEPLPVLIPPSTADLTICDPDADGFGLFDLDALIPDMLQGAGGITVTFHETLPNAQAGNNPKASPYLNISPTTQIMYVRALNTVTGCVSVMPITLHVINSPEIPAVLPPADFNITKCDQDANTQDGKTNFDLTVNEAEIYAMQSQAASNYTITYYESLAAAQAGTTPIIQVTNYTNNITLGNPQTIWVRVSAVGTDCYNVGSFEIRVNSPLALATPSQLTICDDGPTAAIPQAVFDLSVKDSEITGGAANYTVAYYVTQADALAGVNPITPKTAYTNTANAQTLFVSVSGPGTGASACTAYTTLTIRVLPLPMPKTDPVVLEACDDNAPVGTELFDLTTNEVYIRDNDPGLLFEYYASQADAIAQSGQISTPGAYETGSGFIYIRVMRGTEANSQGDFCYVIVKQELIVHPLPVVQVAENKHCDPAAAGTYLFTLSDTDDDVLAADLTQNPADFTVTYYLNLANAQAGVNPLPDSYTNITNPQDIIAWVVNNTTGCTTSAVVTLRVDAGASASDVTATAVCDTDTDGFLDVMLSDFDIQVLNGQPGANFTVAYFANTTDAASGSNPLASPYNMQTGVVYAVVTNTATTCRSDYATVGVTIEPLKDIIISSTTGGNTLCVEWTTDVILNQLTLSSNLPNDGSYTFQWALNGAAIAGATGATYNVPLDSPGDYSLIATSILGCVSTTTQAFTTVQSGPAVPTGTGYIVSNYFSDDQSVTITVEGEGAGFYQYQMDDGPILDNGGVFTGVPPGIHTVYVYDYKGNGVASCSSIPITDIQVVDYPKFFTPNGDGINDTWNIIGLDGLSKIYIFDRYGKLIKEISPEGTGWDGTFNGQPLPSTDYWFSVAYPETTQTSTVNKEFKAHFSLKR
jgi:gliding motility-associated-like protein